jgi:CRP-like cAMP-binding protein
VKEELVQTLEKFFSKYKIIKYSKGEIIAKPGQKLDFVGFIKSGYARMYMINNNGQEITMQFFKPILYFTTIMAMTETDNQYYFEAVSPVEMYICPKNEAVEYFRKNGEIERELEKSIMLAFLDLTDQIGYLLSGTAYNKIAAILISLNKRNEKNGKTALEITHKMLASLTGLTRETVTLQMIKLDKAKIIENKSKKVVILNEKRLKEIAMGETL